MKTVKAFTLHCWPPNLDLKIHFKSLYCDGNESIVHLDQGEAYTNLCMSMHTCLHACTHRGIINKMGVFIGVCISVVILDYSFIRQRKKTG